MNPEREGALLVLTLNDLPNDRPSFRERLGGVNQAENLPRRAMVPAVLGEPDFGTTRKSSCLGCIEEPDPLRARRLGERVDRADAGWSRPGPPPRLPMPCWRLHAALCGHRSARGAFSAGLAVAATSPEPFPGISRPPLACRSLLGAFHGCRPPAGGSRRAPVDCTSRPEAPRGLRQNTERLAEAPALLGGRGDGSRSLRKWSATETKPGGASGTLPVLVGAVAGGSGARRAFCRSLAGRSARRSAFCRTPGGASSSGSVECRTFLSRARSSSPP